MTLTENKQTDQLIKNWYNLRQRLETDETPFLTVVKYFLKFPKVKIYTDPYDQSTWPTPWELIAENQYCRINFLLAVAYSLQLTERFSNISPEIAIAIDSYSKTVYYLLIINDQVLGYADCIWCTVNDLPKSLIIQKKIQLGKLH